MPASSEDRHTGFDCAKRRSRTPFLIVLEASMSPSPDQLNALMKPGLPGALGMTIIEASPDRAVGRMLVRPEVCTVGSILHGGAIMAFADTLGAVATVSNLPPGARTTTLESKTNFIGAAPVGTEVTGTTTAIHKGRTTHVWQTRITGPGDKLIAIVTQTQMVLPAQSPGHQTSAEPT
jgi:uncharacterized protein (TIGR00369 family)